MRTVRLLEKVGTRRPDTLATYDDVSAATLVESGRAEYADTPVTFDPAEHTVAEVLDYLRAADEVEQHRVLGLERAGKVRVGILEATL